MRTPVLVVALFLGLALPAKADVATAVPAGKFGESVGVNVH